jgi:hypothetical protein
MTATIVPAYELDIRRAHREASHRNAMIRKIWYDAAAANDIEIIERDGEWVVEHVELPPRAPSGNDAA